MHSKEYSSIEEALDEDSLRFISDGCCAYGMPRRMQIWYFEKVRGGGKGTYDVGVIPTRFRIRKLLADAGFSITVSPRELWINYLRDRVSRPEEVRAGIKRKMASYISSRRWPFENPLMRWIWDVSVGSNFIIAKAP